MLSLNLGRTVKVQVNEEEYESRQLFKCKECQVPIMYMCEVNKAPVTCQVFFILGDALVIDDRESFLLQKLFHVPDYNQ